jgi:hypothetical protein
MEKLKGMNMVDVLCYVYENRTMKYLEIVLSLGGELQRG